MSEARAEQWGRRGAPVRLYSRAEMAALTGTDHWHGGWGNSTGGRINPLGLARGMAPRRSRRARCCIPAARRARIRRRPGGWLLDTPRGTLAAERIVIATQAHTDDLWPGLKRTLVPVRSYQMATSVLSDNIRRTILPEGHALSDTRGDLYFYRFDGSGRLVTGGGLIVPFAWDSRIRARIAARVASRLSADR